MQTDNTVLKKKRQLYIDCLRGTTMMLVVYFHVFYFCTMNNAQSNVSNFFVYFRMPLFFFISGFVSYKMAEWDWSLFKKMEIKKVRGALLPSLVVMSVYLLVTGGNLHQALFSDFKAGYWFTLALFEIYTIYATMCILLKINMGG